MGVLARFGWSPHASRVVSGSGLVSSGFVYSYRARRKSADTVWPCSAARFSRSARTDSCFMVVPRVLVRLGRMLLVALSKSRMLCMRGEV